MRKESELCIETNLLINFRAIPTTEILKKANKMILKIAAPFASTSKNSIGIICCQGELQFPQKLSIKSKKFTEANHSPP